MFLFFILSALLGALAQKEPETAAEDFEPLEAIRRRKRGKGLVKFVKFMIKKGKKIFRKRPKRNKCRTKNRPKPGKKTKKGRKCKDSDFEDCPEHEIDFTPDWDCHEEWMGSGHYTFPKHTMCQYYPKTGDWEKCSDENGRCECMGRAIYYPRSHRGDPWTAYGHNPNSDGQYKLESGSHWIEGDIQCNNYLQGDPNVNWHSDWMYSYDPAPGQHKQCSCVKCHPKANCKSYNTHYDRRKAYKCAAENKWCTCHGTVWYIRQGWTPADTDHYHKHNIAGKVLCSNTEFGNPDAWYTKECLCQPCDLDCGPNATPNDRATECRCNNGYALKADKVRTKFSANDLGQENYECVELDCGEGASRGGNWCNCQAGYKMNLKSDGKPYGGWSKRFHVNAVGKPGFHCRREAPVASCEDQCKQNGYVCDLKDKWGLRAACSRPSCQMGCALAEITNSATQCRQKCGEANGQCHYMQDGLFSQGFNMCVDWCKEAKDGCPADHECNDGCAYGHAAPVPSNAASAVKCAREGGRCGCIGKVYYGMEQFNSLAEMMQHGHKVKGVNGGMNCNNEAFGGDPVPGQVKACWCITEH